MWKTLDNKVAIKLWQQPSKYRKLRILQPGQKKLFYFGRIFESYSHNKQFRKRYNKIQKSDLEFSLITSVIAGTKFVLLLQIRFVFIIISIRIQQKYIRNNLHGMKIRNWKTEKVSFRLIFTERKSGLKFQTSVHYQSVAKRF